MKLSEAVKPISYFKAHASEGVRDIVATEYEKDRESLALLKILALSRKSVNQGKVRPVGEAFAEVRSKIVAEER